MAFKIRDAHLEIIIDCMENHNELATGKFISLNAKENHKKLWEQLAVELNASGFGERSVEKWQKSWRDFKYSLKKKSASLNRDRQATGGGPQQTTQISDLDTRFLALLGQTFSEDVGAPERGINLEPGPSQKRAEEKDIVEMNDGNNINECSIPLEINISTHTSTPSVKRKRPTTDPVELYQQTIDTMNVLNTTLDGRLGQIANALQGFQQQNDNISQQLADLNTNIVNQTKQIVEAMKGVENLINKFL